MKTLAKNITRLLKRILPARKKSQLANLESWVQQDTNVVPAKMRVDLKGQHLSLALGSDFTIETRTSPMGELAILLRSGFAVAALEAYAGSKKRAGGSRKLTILSDQGKNGPELYLSTYGPDRRPSIELSKGGASISTDQVCQSDDINSLLQSLSDGFFSKPLF